MELKVWWPEYGQDKGLSFGLFLQKMVSSFGQMMANRLIMGIHRYDKGRPIRKAKYLTRLKGELEEYERTGNQEHLVNIANYCFLECEAPEHPNSHFEHRHKSVTRDKMRMKL